MEINEITLQAKGLNQQGVILAKVGSIDVTIEKFNKVLDYGSDVGRYIQGCIL